jgi:hypothetical protein
MGRMRTRKSPGSMTIAERSFDVLALEIRIGSQDLILAMT